MTLVTLSHVDKRFGRSVALRDVSLSLGPGVTGLLGPNGAGKTTLLRTVATVLSPDDGTVAIFGRDARDPRERLKIRAGLGYLPQELGFPRGFTAFQFVDYMAVLKGCSDKASRHDEVRRVLAATALAEVSTTKVAALSGGQRRRLGLAQALLGDPRLLVLDEPTAGLDPEQRAAFRGLLAGLATRTAVLVSTHQTEDVGALAERVVVLDAGRVTFDGEVRELVARAAGQVWLADTADPTSLASWRLPGGSHRCVGLHPPFDATCVDPTLEDAYLLLRASGSTPTEALS